MHRTRNVLRPGAASAWRRAAVACCVALLASCATRVRAPASAPTPPAPAASPAVMAFAIQAVPLDAWNAIGDIVVRTPQASYDGRSQMLGLYSVHYRGQPLLILAHALPLSDTIHVLTTEVTARSPPGAPLDSATATELLAVLQRELPAEIERVHARQAAAAAADAVESKHVRKAKHHRTTPHRKR